MFGHSVGKSLHFNITIYNLQYVQLLLLNQVDVRSEWVFCESPFLSGVDVRGNSFDLDSGWMCVCVKYTQFLAQEY